MIYRSRHFKIHEVVCPHVLAGFSETQAWSFFDERLLMTVDFLGDQLGIIYANNYFWGGNKDERGIRCILCSEVISKSRKNKLYCSAHIRAQALDFVVKKMASDKVGLWIMSNYLVFPFPIRIEKNRIGYTHLDVCNQGTNKVELFIPKT
jgi:hypothetical protein